MSVLPRVTSLPLLKENDLHCLQPWGSCAGTHTHTHTNAHAHTGMHTCTHMHMCTHAGKCPSPWRKRTTQDWLTIDHYPLERDWSQRSKLGAQDPSGRSNPSLGLTYKC